MNSLISSSVVYVDVRRGMVLVEVLRRTVSGSASPGQKRLSLAVEGRRSRTSESGFVCARCRRKRTDLIRMFRSLSSAR